MRSEACLVLLRKTGTQLFNLSPSGTGNIQVKAVTAIVFTPSSVLQMKVMVPHPSDCEKSWKTRNVKNSRFFHIQILAELPKS